jgi:hypothetical protein
MRGLGIRAVLLLAAVLLPGLAGAQPSPIPHPVPADCLPRIVAPTGYFGPKWPPQKRTRTQAFRPEPFSTFRFSRSL